MSPCATASIRGISASSPTARPVRCCCPRLSTCCRRGGSWSRLTRGCSRRSGLLSTDLVYYSSRSSYVMLAAEAAPAIAAVFEQMETQLRATIADDTVVTVRRSFDGRLMGQSWETPFVELPDGPIDEAMIATMVSLFHDQYERRYGNRFDVRSRAGCHLPRAADRPVREGRVRRRRPPPRRQPQPDAHARAALLRRRRAARWASIVATSLPVGARVDGPAIIREDTLDDVRLPAADGRDRPLRRDRDRAGGVSMTRAARPRRRRVRRALRLRPVHSHGADEPLRLHRRAHVRAPADGRVLADPARLLRLRRDLDRARPRGLGHPGDEQQHHALHRHDGRLGAERDRGVRCRAARAGRRHRRERPVPDRHPRQRRPLQQAGVHERRARRVRQPESAPARHGRRVPGGFSVAKRTVYENGLVLSPRPLFKAGEPVPETWSLIFDNVRFGEILYPDMQTVCAELVARRAAAARDRRALRRRGGPRGDALRLRRRGRADHRRHRRHARRQLGGRGDRRLRRGRRLRGVPDQRPGDEAGRPARGRLQRHVAPGPHVHQRDRARRQDVRRDRDEVLFDPAGPSRRRCCATSTSCYPRARS